MTSWLDAFRVSLLWGLGGGGRKERGGGGEGREGMVVMEGDIMWRGAFVARKKCQREHVVLADGIAGDL